MKTVELSPKRVPFIIHVNGHNIRDNRNYNVSDPVITVRRGRGGVAEYAHEVKIHGESTVVYGRPLSCGAEVWISTMSDVTCLTYNGDDDNE